MASPGAPAGIPTFVPPMRCAHANVSPQDSGNFRGHSSLIGTKAGDGPPTVQNEENAMLGWVVTFLVVALIAGILGFGGIAGVSIEIAKVIFFIAVILFLISAIFGLARGRRLN